MTAPDAQPEHPWDRALWALRLLAVDPGGLGGLWLRARSGPVRDRFLTGLAQLPLPIRRFAPSIGDDQLYGALDLAATLAAGHLRVGRGLLTDPAALLLTMAERTPPGLSARLAAALDGGTGLCLIAADEGADPEETLPPVLADRLAFHVDLDAVGLQETEPPVADDQVAVARDRLADIRLADGAVGDLVILAARLGIDSPRAPLLALRAARAAAALHERAEVAQADLALAVALVYAPRATIVPQDAPEEADRPPEPEAPEPQPDTPDSDSDTAEAQPQLPAELLLEAVKAALPPDLLARLAALKARQGRGAAGTGAARKGNRRGRPIPSRPGRLDGTSRLDLVATLRAAAPWQPMRRAAAVHEQALHIRPSDIRVKRYEEKSDRLLVFAVDASGSAALARLAEAKGAVELLLAEAYARRDHVALVAFRGESAETLLPPTRSLVQTKRRLSALPGGGGTPLAAGLQSAMALALQGRARGMTPTICLLTDGRANIALDGRADRAAAAEDSSRLARAIRASGLQALVIDMSKRPQKSLEELAAALAAPYVPLPRADAGRLSASVAAALES
jgi:magnesium chelatase subunit D